jgi:dihydrofolate reductase
VTAIVLVAAVGRNGVIGADGGLPWRLSSDLKRFKALTWGKPMLMGRKTWESIGKALPGRISVVVSRDPAFAPADARVARSVAAGLELARQAAAELGADEIAVVGGGEVYRQTIALADRLAITEVDLAPPGDALFPAIDPIVWRETAREAHAAGPRDEAAYAFVDYSRRINTASNR